MKPILLLAFAFVGCSQLRVGYSGAGRMAKDTSIVGKGTPGQCLPFAKALDAKLKAAGYESHIVITPWPDGLGSHASVQYDDAGRICEIDNMTWMPWPSSNSR